MNVSVSGMTTMNSLIALGEIGHLYGLAVSGPGCRPKGSEFDFRR
jgi:hypothetical protein